MKCPFCDAEVSGNSRYCPGCGAEVSNSGDDEVIVAPSGFGDSNRIDISSGGSLFQRESNDESRSESTAKAQQNLSAISGWNWGAFFLPPIWALGNGLTVIGLVLLFIPWLNTFASFYLGAKGNELAWNQGRYKSVYEFQQAQQKWAMWGFIVFFSLLLIGILAVIFSRD